MERDFVGAELMLRGFHWSEHLFCVYDVQPMSSESDNQVQDATLRSMLT